MTFPTTAVAAAVLGASISWTTAPSGSLIAAERIRPSTDSSQGPLFAESNVVRLEWHGLARSVFPAARDLTRDEGDAYEELLRDLFH
jgi:hypothetical protein